MAVDHKVIAEREKQVAQDKVNKYTSDLSYIASANNIVVVFFIHSQILSENFNQICPLISFKSYDLISLPVSVLILVAQSGLKEYVIRTTVLHKH